MVTAPVTLHFLGTGHIRSSVTAPVWNVRIISSDFSWHWPYWKVALLVQLQYELHGFSPALLWSVSYFLFQILSLSRA